MRFARQSDVGEWKQIISEAICSWFKIECTLALLKCCCRQLFTKTKSKVLENIIIEEMLVLLLLSLMFLLGFQSWILLLFYSFGVFARLPLPSNNPFKLLSVLKETVQDYRLKEEVSSAVMMSDVIMSNYYQWTQCRL